MSREKFFKSSLGRILFGMTFVLLAVLLVVAGTLSYAKYINTEEEKQSAGVANMGVELFEFVEYGNVPEGTIVKDLKIDFTKVVPGADIPGPHIQLKINSEVSYSLFVKVTATPRDPGKTFPLMWSGEKVVEFNMSEKWEKVEGQEGLYRYIVKSANGVNDCVFKPATKYDYTGIDEIQLLEADVIYISQYYPFYDPSYEFTLSFETFVRQVLG